jgi:diguanylate cyclase
MIPQCLFRGSDSRGRLRRLCGGRAFMESAGQGKDKLLVIDGSGNMYGEIALLLHSLYRIDNAKTYAEAAGLIEAAVASGEPYAIVFLDADVPSGNDVVQAAGGLRGCDPHLGLVVCTVSPEDGLKRMAAGQWQEDRPFFMRRPMDSVSARQIVPTLVQKWHLEQQVRCFGEKLESEVLKQTRELESRVLQLDTDANPWREKEFLLAHFAHYDILTGLLNRRSFYEFVGGFVGGHQAEKGCSSLSLLYIGMDGFKKVNDRWGNGTGNRLLSEIASRIRESAEGAACRLDAAAAALADPTPESAIFRMGGDEFTLLVGCPGSEEVRAMSQRILNAIRKPFRLREQEITISCSIGVSQLHADAPDFGTMLRHADMAMHKAKEKGGSIVFHDQLRGAGWLDPVILAADMNAAMEENQMEVFHQRIVDKGNRLSGLSALIRWRHPHFGMILPDDFLAIAERLGILPALERRILRMACRQMSSMSAMELSGLFVLVHCSAGLFFDPGFGEFVRQTLLESGLSPKRLMIVLQEGTLQRDNELALSIIRGMSDSGIRFSVECSGINQALQQLLRVLPLGTVIQIDRSLLAGITRKASDRLFLRNMLNLMQDRGFPVLIGGVETAGQEEFLQGRDCLRQGFLYGAPMPFDEFVQGLGNGDLHHMENMNGQAPALSHP